MGDLDVDFALVRYTTRGALDTSFGIKRKEVTRHEGCFGKASVNVIVET